MKAVLLYGRQDLRIQDVEVPEVGAGDILLRTKASYVCGTDVRMYKKGMPGIGAENPRILGHEISGLIETVGDGENRYRRGMRVTVLPNYGCGICDFCVDGNSQLCGDFKAIGISIDGGFAEYVLIPEKAVKQGNVVEIKSTVSFEEAALAEPLSCVYNAFKKIGIYDGDTVLIIGAGPIGIMHAKIARMAGAARIIINDIVRERLDLVELMDPFFEVLETRDLKKSIMEKTDGRGVDLVITAASAPSIQTIAFELAGINGRVMFFGGLPPDKSKIYVDTNQIHYKQITVSGTTRQRPSHFRKVLELITNGGIDLKDIITESVGLDDVARVLTDINQGIGLKKAILPDSES